MFEWSEEDERWTAVHHPFTRPMPESEAMLEKDPGSALAVTYDLVGNGEELGGGSVRIHEADLQSKVFDILQISPEEQQARFGFLLEALGMGAPPHGGIAFGIDRMVMVLAREPNLRDTVAFPKNQAGFDPMSGAPAEVPRAAARRARNPARAAEGETELRRRPSAADGAGILEAAEETEERNERRGTRSSARAAAGDDIAAAARGPARSRREATTRRRSATHSSRSAATPSSSRPSFVCSRPQAARPRSSPPVTPSAWMRFT